MKIRNLENLRVWQETRTTIKIIDNIRTNIQTDRFFKKQSKQLTIKIIP